MMHFPSNEMTATPCRFATFSDHRTSDGFEFARDTAGDLFVALLMIAITLVSGCLLWMA